MNGKVPPPWLKAIRRFGHFSASPLPMIEASGVTVACHMVERRIRGCNKRTAAHSDATITVAGQSGNFQLNVMLPVVAYNLLQSIELLASSSRLLADTAIEGFSVNEARLAGALERNPILVTALNPVIGYEKGAAIAKKAYAEGEPVRAVAARETDLSDSELAALLDPTELTKGGLHR